MKLFIKRIVFLLISTLQDTLNILRTLKKGKREIFRLNSNKAVLVVGNGPSLNDINLLLFRRNYIIACVNFFPIKYKNFNTLKPEYLFLIDPAFFREKTMSDILEKRTALWRTLESVDWHLTIVLPQKYLLPIKNENITVNYINSNSAPFNNSKFRLYTYNHNFATTGTQNVVNVALYYFIMQNYGKIYLCGLDMDEFKAYKIDGRNHVLADVSHYYGNDFYDYTEEGEIKINDFHTYFGYYSKILDQFYYSSCYAKEKHCTVINTTINSFVDVFEKKEWQTVLEDYPCSKTID